MHDAFSDGFKAVVVSVFFTCFILSLSLCADFGNHFIKRILTGVVLGFCSLFRIGFIFEWLKDEW